MKILVFSNIDFKLLGEKKKSKFCKGLPSIAVLQPWPGGGSKIWYINQKRPTFNF